MQPSTPSYTAQVGGAALARSLPLPRAWRFAEVTYAVAAPLDPTVPYGTHPVLLQASSRATSVSCWPPTAPRTSTLPSSTAPTRRWSLACPVGRSGEPACLCLPAWGWSLAGVGRRLSRLVTGWGWQTPKQKQRQSSCADGPIGHPCPPRPLPTPALLTLTASSLLHCTHRAGTGYCRSTLTSTF